MRSPAAPASFDAVAHALADGTRRGLLRLVTDDELAAGELAGHFPEMSRPAVSQHLRVLEGAGLVSIRPDGRRRLYRARREGLTEVWQFVDDMWSDRLGRLKQAAEATEAADTTPSARGPAASPTTPPEHSKRAPRSTP